MANSLSTEYIDPHQPVRYAAKRLSTTTAYLRGMCLEGLIPGAHKRYCWEGNWLRMRWHVPIGFELARGGCQ